MKIKPKTTRIAFTPEEKRGYFERIVNSARVQRNRKKYHRPSQKEKKDE